MALTTCPECGKDVSELAEACPHCGNPLNPRPPVNQNMLTALKVVIVASGVTILGSFLPWASITAPLLGTVSTMGHEGDGLFTAIAGALIGVVAYAGHSRGALTGALKAGLLVLSLLVIAIGISDLSSVKDVVDAQNIGNTFDDSGVRASVGVGLYLVVGGGLAAGIASLIAVTAKLKQPA